MFCQGEFTVRWAKRDSSLALQGSFEFFAGFEAPDDLIPKHFFESHPVLQAHNCFRKLNKKGAVPFDKLLEASLLRLQISACEQYSSFCGKKYLINDGSSFNANSCLLILLPNQKPGRTEPPHQPYEMEYARLL